MCSKLPIDKLENETISVSQAPLGYLREGKNTLGRGGIARDPSDTLKPSTVSPPSSLSIDHKKQEQDALIRVC